MQLTNASIILFLITVLSLSHIINFLELDTLNQWYSIISFNSANEAYLIDSSF